MGLFSKKPKKNKMYTLQEAMSFVSQNQGYSVLQEEGGGYKVIPDSVANEHIKRYKERMREKRSFQSGILAGFTPTRITRSSNYTHRYGYEDRDGR